MQRSVCQIRPLPVADLPLKVKDPQIYALIEKEKERQWAGIELIASENFTSTAVMECLGSCLTNKYSEGYPAARYYGGNIFIDQIEVICKERALKAFGVKPSEWGVNVQPYSGSPANLAVYTGLLKPGDKIMGMALPSGGHLTHGHKTDKKKISATSVFFESSPYYVNESTGYIDYDKAEEIAKSFKPNIVVCGFSAYPRSLDFARFRKIADSVGALLMADIAHISGLVATGETPSPFGYCDIVTTTTHKTLRGPRAGVIFSKKELNEKIDFAVFPMLQGGPHNHQIAAIATQFLEVQSPEFKQYAIQVKKNAKELASQLIKRNHKLVTDGTDNHLMLWDVRPIGLNGNKIEKLCERAHITLNKNSIVGDKSAATPGGVRIGTPAITTRGCVETDMEDVAEFLHRASMLCIDIQKKSGKKITDFVEAIDKNQDVVKLGEDVKKWSTGFSIPGYIMKKD